MVVDRCGEACREGDKMTYADEVLVLKSDLEERQQRISELQSQARFLPTSPAASNSTATRISTSCYVCPPPACHVTPAGRGGERKGGGCYLYL